MNLENSIENTVYPRITKEMMEEYMGKPVSIVGKFVDIQWNKLTLEVAKDSSQSYYYQR